MFTLAKHDKDAAIFIDGERQLRLRFMAEAIVRVTFTEGRAFSTRQSRIVVAQPKPVTVWLGESEHLYSLHTGALSIELLKSTGALRYRTGDGRLLFEEPERGGKWLTKKTVTRNVFDANAPIAIGQSIDGARATATSYETIVDREAFEAKLEFAFSEDEALFGLGSHEEGYANMRGSSRELYQQNMKAVVPHLVGSRGWGVLLDCESLMTFHDDALGSYWWADVVEELDYYVLGGGSHEAVMRQYRELTGATPMPPRWAFGFVQSKERYVNESELVEVVREHRRRAIPLDCIVLDWKSWPNGAGWGQKSFDAVRFPDASGFIDELHALGAKLMVSIWPIMTGGCENQRELHAAGMMLGNQSTYDAFSSDARAVYWKQAHEGLFAHGVDAWWCDCTEPFEADWSGAVKPEPHQRLLLNTGESKLYLDAGEINSYSLVHSQGIWEGQRGSGSEKRVLNLTRSSYAGQHRYGTVTWNGDVTATWETLRRSVAEGLNFCATGEAYWTTDAGAFFIANDPKLWFWRGDYNAGTRGLTDMNALEPDANDTGCTDLGFHELYTRWLQWCVFLPMMRSHGTDAAREAWRFGEPFYDAIVRAIRLRYELLPYLYSLAWRVTAEGMPMVEALALRFPRDRRTHAVADQYMFGPSLMVCPVLRPQIYGRDSRALDGVKATREVYLPHCAGWYDLRSDRWQAGGQNIEADTPLRSIPVYARAGSILPMGSVIEHTGDAEQQALFLRVYTGADAVFTLYEDAGDGYGYEHGECARIEIMWFEVERQLVLGVRQGSCPGMLRERDVCLIFFQPTGTELRTVRYVGEQMTIGVHFDEHV